MNCASFRTAVRTAGAAALVGQLALLLPAFAQENTYTMDPLVVTGKAEDLLGVAQSATKGQASAAEIQARPYLRRGEILETVPGVIVTQHAGGGKANQYFLRGFNLDHGTDFAISIDGMPVNMRTHAHGQVMRISISSSRNSCSRWITKRAPTPRTMATSPARAVRTSSSSTNCRKASPA